MQKSYLTRYDQGTTHQVIKPTTSHLLKTNRFIKFKCPKTSCPVHTLCEQKSLTHTSAEVTYYKGAKEVDVVFIHQPRALESKVCGSDVGLGLRRLIEYVVEKEFKKPVGIAHLNMLCTPKGGAQAWQECRQVLFSLIKKLNPRLIVLVGERVAGNVLDISMDYSDDKPAGNRLREIHSIFTSVDILGKTYQALPILSLTGVYDTPTMVLCNILEDLRRALGVYLLKPMTSQAEIVELRTVEQVKEFVDYVIQNVDAEAIAVDTEDKNLNRVYGNKLDSVQFCWDPKKAYFLWYSHPKTPFSPSDLKIVREELCRLFTAMEAKFKYWLIHNAKFDLHIFLTQLGVRPVKPAICTMTFPFILEENYTDSPYGGFGLKHLAKKHGFQGFDNPEVLNARKAGKLRDIPDSEFVKYATDDVVATVQLYYILKEIARGQGFLEEAMRLMTFFFSRVYAFLVEMEHNGIYIDQTKLRELSGPFSPINVEMNDIAVNRLRASQAAQKANALLVRDTATDVPLFGDPWIFDIDKVKHKQALFFGVQGLKPVSRNKKDVPVSIGGKVIDVGKMDKKFQTKYAPTVAEVQWLVDYQQLKKLKTSYIKSINKFLDPELGYEDYYNDQMLRPEFSLMAKTGRARASKPNSQQIPKGNTDIRKEVRSLYCTPPGWAIISLDYMAVEVRCWGILSEDREMIKMFKQAKSYRDNWRTTKDPKWLRMAELYGDIHIMNASILFDVKPEEVTKVMRNAVKALTFGTIYGMGLTTMAAQMGCDVNEAKRRRDKAFSKFKQAGQWLMDIEKEATTNYYVCSPLKRRRRLWELIFDENFLECAGVDDKIKDNMRIHCARAKRQGRNCVDYKTEILTKTGWKKYNEINVGEPALTKSIESGELKWQLIEAVHLYPDYEGDIYDIRSESFSSTCTPNHRWLVYNRHKKIHEMRETSKLDVWGSHAIHRTGDYRTPETSEWSDSEIGIIGWTLTDGHYCKDPKWNLNGIDICQVKEVNKPEIDRCLKEAGFKYSRYERPLKNPENSHIETIWYFTGDFAKKIRITLPDKQLTPEFLLSLTSKQLEILRAAMVGGDGSVYQDGNINHVERRLYYAATEHEADLFQMLLTLLGKSCVKTYIPSSKSEIRYPSVANVIRPTKGIWVVREHTRKYTQIAKSQIKKEFRKEPVWCITIKNSTFVARRENQTYITGNSPIQGFASDVTFLSASILFQNVILKENKNWKFFNAVHDAIYLRVPIDEIGECVAACERIFTHEIADFLEKEFNYKLPLPLEAEFEIGTHGGNLKKWNFSEEHLEELIKEIREIDATKKVQVNQAIEKSYNLDSLLEEDFN